MKLEDIFTPEELASIDAGTYDITRPVLAAKLDLWGALERERCAELADEWFSDGDFPRPPLAELIRTWKDKP